jgi:hypothetical protein
LSDREDSKITWITCPDCGAKIGVAISVGRVKPLATSTEIQEVPSTMTLGGVRDKLATAGVDLTLVDVEEGEEIVTVTPKKFLGDLWGPVNDAIRALGGGWIRDGRASHWEISRENLE